MRQARLEVVDAAGRWRRYPLDKDVFTVGRRAENDLILQKPDVSRDHAKIVRDGDRFVLHDSQSRYGTFVNDAKVERYQLCHGDRIQFGPKSDLSTIFLCDDTDLTTGTTASIAVAELRNVGRLLEGLRQVGAGGMAEEVLALVLDLAIEVSVAERGFVMLAADGGLEIRVARARGRVSIPGGTFKTSRKIPEEVFRSGETQAVPDLEVVAEDHPHTKPLQLHHVFCAPLRLVRFVDKDVAPEAQRIIGVLYLDSRQPCAVSADARTALEMLATEAAVVIENARLYRETIEKVRLEQEMKIAAKIQQALLPPGSWTGAYFEAMGATLPCRAIGGDFFEYMSSLPSGEAGFAVADVAGKGAPAALLTAVIQGALAAHASIPGGPADVLSRVNRTLARRAVESRFATLLYGVMSPDGRFTYCNAGHNAPFLFGRSGIRRLETGGTILGLFEAAFYDEETVELDPGDVVLAFSDGLSEAMSAEGEEFGDTRVEDCLRRHAGDSPADLLRSVLSSLREFCQGAVQNDDVTVLVVKYLGKPGGSR